MTMVDNQDPMDQRLRDYGQRWRRVLPPPSGVDIEGLSARPPTRSTWWWVSAAAAVSAVIVGAQMTGSHPEEAAPSSESVRPGDVVPWAPLVATHPRIPSRTIPATPDPLAAAEAPLCRARDLRPESRKGAAAGTAFLNVRLTLSGDSPCRVEGFPNIRPMNNGQRVDIPIERVADDSTYHGPVLVADGQPALLRLGWASDWCTAAVGSDTIEVQLARGDDVLTFDGFGRSQSCNGDPGSGPTPIMVWAFQPERTRPEHVRSGYTSMRVSGDLNLTASPGEQVRFLVTLTAPEDVVLDPCPDYTITQHGAGVTQAQRFALNCADVPYKDPEGRPYLPANTPVPFAMQTTAGSDSARKLSWQLAVPGNSAAVGGQLTLV